LFLERGHQVSTAAIAEAAGVSEGTIFKRFPTKEALFRAAMDLPSLDVCREARVMPGEGAVRDNLAAVARVLLGYFRVVIPRMMMLWSHHAFCPANTFSQTESPPPVRAVASIAEYLGAEMKLGRVRPCEPEVVARMMVATLHHFVFFEALGLQRHFSVQAERAYEASVIDVLITGVGPETDPGGVE
jgi:AcrR family transcriptional regulator